MNSEEVSVISTLNLEKVAHRHQQQRNFAKSKVLENFEKELLLNTGSVQQLCMTL